LAGRSRATTALRAEPIGDRTHRLLRLLRPYLDAVRYCEHLLGAGPLVFHEACNLGCEGIVSKRVGSPYESGHSRPWIKTKNPNSPAVRGLEEEDWN
jgi:bifunctional non-homologous end joining protein LigD